MTPDELRAAIEKPAAQGGWDLEPGLVNRFLRDVADQPGALPLLSHALLETWKRRSGRLLTLAGYEEAGGVQGAIAHTADATFAALTPDQQAIARNIFLRLTELGEGVQDTRRRVPLAELASLADVEAVLQKLEDARLVTAVREGEPDAAQPVTFVDVTHEALIREWPRLREWLSEDREGLRLQRKLTEAAQEWAGLGRDPGALYRGVLLQQAQDWAAGHDGELNELERAFLAASVEQVAAERRERERIAEEREAARQRELEQAQEAGALRLRRVAMQRKNGQGKRKHARSEAEGRRVAEAGRAAQAEKLVEEQRLRVLDQEAATRRVRRRARIAAGIGIVAVIFALVAVLLGLQSSYNAAEAQRNADKAQRNADEAQRNADEAQRNADEAQRNADKARQAQELAEVRLKESERQSNINRAQTLRVQSQLELDRNAECSLALALKAYDLAVSIPDFAPYPFQDSVREALQATRTELVLPAHTSLNTVAWSHDGRTVAAGGLEGGTQLWEATEEGFVEAARIPNPDWVGSLAFSPDDSLLAVGGTDIVLWDRAEGKAVGTLQGHGQGVWTMAWHPNGRWLASGSR